MLRRESPRIAVVVGYVLVAIAFTWPLALQLGTSFTGDPGGDTGVYVWNQWVFQREAGERHNPLKTSQILSLTTPVDLSQHNYTAFMNVLAMPLIPWLGIVTTFNVVFLLTTVLTALTTYLLVRRVTGAGRAEAWIAGAAFAWSPVLVARSTAHFSLVAAAPLPAFLLCLIRADRTRRPRDAALAGLCMAWAGFCDVYYAVYCLMIAACYVTCRLVRVTRGETHASAPWRWTLNVLIVCVAALVASLLVGRGGRVNLWGLRLSVHGLYTPMLILTVLIAARVAAELRPHVRLLATPTRTATLMLTRTLLVGAIACAAPLSPVLYGLGERVLDNRFVSPPTLWRSSPPGVDALAFVDPNPNHPLARLIRDKQSEDGAVFVEFTAAFSLVALAVVAIACWRAGYRPGSPWTGLTLVFTALALGPFVHVAGFNTHIPGPWALLRYVPIIGAARAPTRFAVVAALGLAVLFAGALSALGRRYPQHRRLLVTTVGVLLLVELLPAPRILYSAGIPSVYGVIAADPRPVRVLQLPFGVRDGVSSFGNFTARYQYLQTFHGKRLIGGYLSRISQKHVGEVRSQPTLDALITLSEGRRLTPEHAAFIRARGARFVSRSNLGYVVIDERECPPALAAFVIDAWRLVEIARDGPVILYQPTVTPDARMTAER
jgi:hypothetical protein